MKTQPRHSHRRTILFMIFAIILCAASAGLGSVWLRQQISYLAGNYAQMEIELNDLDRRNSYLSERIERERQPQALLSRVHGTGLRPTVELQVVRASLRGKGYVPEPENILRPFESFVDVALNHTSRRSVVNE